MQMENAPTEPQRNKSPSAETNVSFPKQVDVRGGGGQKRIRIQKNSPSAATSSNKVRKNLSCRAKCCIVNKNVYVLRSKAIYKSLPI